MYMYSLSYESDCICLSICLRSVCTVPWQILIHVLMRDEKEGRKKEASKVKHTTAKQHSTPKAVTSHVHVHVHVNHGISLLSRQFPD